MCPRNPIKKNERLSNQCKQFYLIIYTQPIGKPNAGRALIVDCGS